MKFLYESRSLNGGEQRLYRFTNGYGASVIQHSCSYGNEEGLWELAVIHYDDNGKYKLDYSTHITDDVLGHLSEDEVELILVSIDELPRKE